jgi:hypothetical protein
LRVVDRGIDSVAGAHLACARLAHPRTIVIY